MSIARCELCNQCTGIRTRLSRLMESAPGVRSQIAESKHNSPFMFLVFDLPLCGPWWNSWRGN